jgi:ribonuclease D
MEPEQQDVCTEAAAGIRGRLPAPMIAWVQSPEMARRAQRLGCRLNQVSQKQAVATSVMAERKFLARRS